MNGVAHLLDVLLEEGIQLVEVWVSHHLGTTVYAFVADCALLVGEGGEQEEEG